MRFPRIENNMVFQEQIIISTKGRETLEITDQVQQLVRRSDIKIGICHIFIMHTSASLMLCENADPAVRVDMETFMSNLVPDGAPMFIHTAEGPDNMPAHVRSVLTGSSISCPINAGQCVLGTWQGLYLWEHRNTSHSRTLMVTVYGE